MATESALNTTSSILSAKQPFLRRIQIRGYKSIAFCDISFEPLTILVGRNASGKSNFLDALAFLKDAMNFGLSEATKRRGGWSSIKCRTDNNPKILFDMECVITCGSKYIYEIPNRTTSSPETASINPSPDLTGREFRMQYRVEIGFTERSAPIVLKEQLDVSDPTGIHSAGFQVENGITQRWRSIPNSEEPLDLPHTRKLLSLGRPDILLLSRLGSQPFVNLADGLRSIGVYDFIPAKIRELQKTEVHDLLESDGRNLAGILYQISVQESNVLNRIRVYLSAIVNEIDYFETIRYGEYETIRFSLRNTKSRESLDFDAANMSDGTLRVLAALTAAFQSNKLSEPNVVAIEEPETSLHPAAMRALVAALDEATLRTQILLTTHSTELLDAPEIRPENVRVVEMVDGQTVITKVDEASESIVRDHLNTLGGMQRDRQLELNQDDLERQNRLAQQESTAP